MKFITNRETFLKPLQMVTGAVERRHTLPILANVLIRVEGTVVALTGTDLEVELKARFNVGVSEAGEITVPARKLMDIVRELPDSAEIAIELIEQKLHIKCGRFRSSLSTLPANEYPSVDSSEISQQFSINAAALRKLIDRTSFAMAQQDVRYFLNGMLIEVDKSSLKAVATDGHRLALSSMEISSDDQHQQQVIVPRKGVIELHRMLGEVDDEVKITLGTNHLIIETDTFSLMTKLVDGKYPEYERVIPRNGDKVVMGDTLELKQALNRTAILSNEKFRGIRLALESGTIKLSANNPEQEEAEETVSVEYEGDSMEVGFNVSYLLDVLGVLESEKVRITVKDANNSALLEEPGDESSVYVVMPMKL